jgi:hypothetical protein
MGFLDNSNANIIVDAVLTDLGRQLLAANDNSFAIRRFSLGDDEIDYGTITKFGFSVGKEKIEKNTPVFEAQTNTDLALKYNCVSINATALTTYPNLTLSSTSGASIAISSAGSINGYVVNLVASSTSLASSTVQVIQIPASGQSTIQADLAEDLFYVKLNRRFLSLGTVVETSQPNGIDVYEVIATVASGATSSTANFQLRTILNNTSTDFTTYGNGTQIITPVRIVGARSGIVSDLIVKITTA